MTVAIMQPYLFPYIGYFQLVAAVDKFVLLDDVNYIKKGWVNRNNLLESGAASLFTVPLSGASQNRRINEIAVAMDDGWQEKLWRRITITYAKAPHFGAVAQLIEQGLRQESVTISSFNRSILLDVLHYLTIGTIVIPSSDIYGNNHLKGSERILDICLRESAERYINPIGGVELYDKGMFKTKGVNLTFLRSRLPEYEQFGKPFVQGLSMIDVLMFNSPDEIREMLECYDLE